MAQFLFSNAHFLEQLIRINATTVKQTEELLQRLGVSSATEDFVTILVISSDGFAGLDILFELGISCERHYKKKIDQGLMKIIVLPTLEAASKSPHLERARFILIPDENLCGVQDYPELEHILPFVQKDVSQK